MLFGSILFILLFVMTMILGALWYNGKGVKYSNWYHALPKINRDRLDVKAFGKCIGKISFLFAFCPALGIVSNIMSIDWLFIVGWVFGFLEMIFASIYVGSGERFRKH